MSVLPRVAESTRERVAREFDDLGPEACMASVMRHLQQHNPELLDIGARWAAEADDSTRLRLGFAMFYGLLLAESGVALGQSMLSPLPQVSAESRNAIVARIDLIGTERLTREALLHLETANPELLQMAHAFASDRQDYVRTMQGFALMHEALLIQLQTDRARQH